MFFFGLGFCSGFKRGSGGLRAAWRGAVLWARHEIAFFLQVPPLQGVLFSLSEYSTHSALLHKIRVSKAQKARRQSQVAKQAAKSFLLSRTGKRPAGATLARAPSRILAQKEIVTATCVTRSCSHSTPYSIDHYD